MSSSNALRQSEHLVNAGINAFQQGQKTDAGVYFFKALELLEDVTDALPRRNMHSELSELFLNTGFEDLALMAVAEALEADKQLDLGRGVTKDQMTHANIMTRLENLERAEASYRLLLEHCLESGDYANAASASTNLAGILANDGYLDEAASLLDESLSYLQKEAFPSTEINTRFMHIQVSELRRVDPQSIFSDARILLDRFGDELTDQHRSILVRFIETTLERFAANRPEFEADTWKRQTFPELFEPSS